MAATDTELDRAPAPEPVRPAASRSGPDVGKALKSAVLGGLVAAGLFVPVMGLRTVQTNFGLTLRDDWPSVAWAVGIVFVGRFLLSLLVWQRPDRRGLAELMPAQAKPLLARAATLLGPALVVLALTMPWFPNTGRVQLDLGILILTYVMLGWGLNIVVGLAGLLDLGYVAFYAVGAYTYALSAHYLGFTFWLALPLSGALAAMWGLMLGFPVLRLRGDYLAIVTLAFGEIVRIVLLNWYWFTGGPNGIGGIPRPSFFGLPFKRGEGGFADFFGLHYSPDQRLIFLYYLILALAFLTNFVTLRLRRLPIGRAWEALREDEIACRSLGINTTNTKLTAFALGAMFGGFAGSFFATRQGFISPESFSFIESALILAIVVLGGMGSQLGVAIAATVLIGGFEYFREFAEYRMLVFGAAMVLIMIWRPRGLISSRTPSVFLKQRKLISSEHVGEGHG